MEFFVELKYGKLLLRASLFKNQFNMRCVAMIVLAMFLLIACDRRSQLNFEGGFAPKISVAPPVHMKPNLVSVQDVERMLIKHGSIELSTADVSAMRKDMEKVVKEFKAYVSSENQDMVEGKIHYEQVIRVAAGRFDAFVKVVEGLSGEIRFREFDTQDVTEEYIDTEARLKTKKELEVRYHQLLAKANNVKEMLAVEEQIANVRSEIESMQGKMNYLKDQVAFCTLTVRYFETTSAPLGFGSRLAASFVTGWNGLLMFLVGVVSIWPFILILALSLWFISRWAGKINFRLRKPQVPA